MRRERATTRVSQCIRRHRQRSRPARRNAAIAGVLAAGALLLGACGAAGSAPQSARSSRIAKVAASDPAGCTTTVHGDVPGPASLTAGWASDLLSVGGYKLPAATVIDVAQHVAFSPPGVVTLPVQPGPIVTKASAIATARRAAHLSRSSAQAKLSSWTEISALLHADHAATSSGAFLVPKPWQPVWAVILTGASPSPGSTSTSSTSSGTELAVIDAASGTAVNVAAIAHQAWFAALTNRDPSLGGCPGGSTAHLPFGVLTRDEETYVATSSPGPLGAQGATTTVILKLTTVSVLNRADPGLYGGCVQQNCSLDELVWPLVVVVRAPAGKTLSCLPPWASYPAGYQPKQVHQYVTIGVAGNSCIICGPFPKWVNQLQDLAPPVSK